VFLRFVTNICFLSGQQDGQTSSGKTHTMLGGGDQRGVLEMAAEDLFNQISESTSRDFLLRVSFVEIYNETIRDLLSKADTTVTIREDPIKGVFCDAMEVIITDYESIIEALTKGNRCTHRSNFSSKLIQIAILNEFISNRRYQKEDS
jgi:Kinesin motor domain